MLFRSQDLRGAETRGPGPTGRCSGPFLHPGHPPGPHGRFPGRPRVPRRLVLSRGGRQAIPGPWGPAGFFLHVPGSRAAAQERPWCRGRGRAGTGFRVPPQPSVWRRGTDTEGRSCRAPPLAHWSAAPAPPRGAPRGSAAAAPGLGWRGYAAVGALGGPPASPTRHRAWAQGPRAARDSLTVSLFPHPLQGAPPCRGPCWQPHYRVPWEAGEP